MTHKSIVLIIMGVSGCGKTTLGNALATNMGWQFKDADDYHSSKNKEKMRRGLPLKDADRLPWLKKLACEIQGWIDNHENTILACSALKQEYRDLLSVSDAVKIVYLKAEKTLLQSRLENRCHEYMNPKLLDSQLKTLEEPEKALILEAHCSLEELVEKVKSRL